MTTNQKFRIQLDFSAKDFAEIEHLVEKLDLSTRAELFRSALVTLRWMIQKKEKECTILAVDPDGRLLEPEFEFLQSLNTPSGEARKVHDNILENLDLPSEDEGETAAVAAQSTSPPRTTASKGAVR
jgi:hypothetical protein